MRARGIPETEVERLVPHRVCPGNRPSNTLCYERLTPETLGTLIALYEHKTFTEGVVLGIDSFDQWGVELGKTLAGEVAAGLRGQIPAPDQDRSTRALIERYRRRPATSPSRPPPGDEDQRLRARLLFERRLGLPIFERAPVGG
jgi:glucose-6-phosphate isomerase